MQFAQKSFAQIQRWTQKYITPSTLTKYQVPLSILAGFIAVTATHYIIDKIDRKIKKYPPGTAGLPLLGSALYMSNESKYFTALGNASPISMIYLFRGRAIMVYLKSITFNVILFNWYPAIKCNTLQVVLTIAPKSFMLVL